MQTSLVEIYSSAVMRHPDRRFPGSLIQGDTLSTFVRSAESAFHSLSQPSPDIAEALAEVTWLRDRLRDRLDHYKEILTEHSIPLPFVEPPPST